MSSGDDGKQYLERYGKRVEAKVQAGTASTKTASLLLDW